MNRMLWAVVVTADGADAAERDTFAAGLREEAAGRPDRVLLVTCHRVELYGLGSPPASSLSGPSAVEHLLRVAAGLESTVVGEDEVLHQVREALRAARREAEVDGRLARLFETAAAAGRRARAGRTASGAGLPALAVEWLEVRAPLSGRPVLVAGAGRMGSALAAAVAARGGRVTVASRSAERAARLARLFAGRGVDLAEGAAWASSSSAVAVALAGPWLQLAAAAALPPIADISAPAAVPAAIRASLNGGFLGIDDLYRCDRPPPPGYLGAAEEIVRVKAAEFVQWLEARG